MGETQVDYLDVSSEIKFMLLDKKLLFYAISTVLFYGAFTVVAYIGVPVKTIYEPIGSPQKAEALVEVYNTYSGYVMAFVEVLLDVYMGTFLPVLLVYVHNKLYLARSPTDVSNTTIPQTMPTMTAKRARNLHRAVLIALPITIALTLGNSIRGLQAGQSSDGFKAVMVVDDLMKEQPLIDRIRSASEAKNGKPTSTMAQQPKMLSVHTVLHNAIYQQSKPFEIDTNSLCGSEDGTPSNTSTDLRLNVHEIDSTSGVYGFVAQEWNSEAISEALVPNTSESFTYKDVAEAKTELQLRGFSISTAFDIVLQGKMVIERAQGYATTNTYSCAESDGIKDVVTSVGDSPVRRLMADEPRWLLNAVAGLRSKQRRLETAVSARAASGNGDRGVADSVDQWEYASNGTRLCQGAVSSLFDMEEFVDPSRHTVENLVKATARVMKKTLDNLAVDETKITLETYTLTPQIQLEAVRIDIPIDATVDYGLCDGDGDTGCNTYTYGDLAKELCGSDGCAFVDAGRTTTMQREVGFVPYVSNCTFGQGHVHYSADFRGFYPSNCMNVANTALLYGIGSFITGDEYSSDRPKGPYIKAPRRHMRFTFAKVKWQTVDLARSFKAECHADTGDTGCTGLWYQLQQSKRFLFAGEDALPTRSLMNADFRVSTSLVQLNSPTIYVGGDVRQPITLESLNETNFKTGNWATKASQNDSNGHSDLLLKGKNCSKLIDSYLKQVKANKYVLEQPLQVMYTSFFFYLMQNAAVTQLNDTSLVVGSKKKLPTVDVMIDGGKVTLLKSAEAEGDRLGNVKLKGDRQVRTIRVSIPPKAFHMSLAGCALVLVLMLCVVFVPARRVRHFDGNASVALQFVAIRSDKDYPNTIHEKRLVFSGTRDSVAFSDLAVERLVLVHKTERNRKVYL